MDWAYVLPHRPDDCRVAMNSKILPSSHPQDAKCGQLGRSIPQPRQTLNISRSGAGIGCEGRVRPKGVLRPTELTALKRTFRDPKVPGLPTRNAWATMPRKRRGHQKWPKAAATRGRAVVRPPSSLATHRKMPLSSIVENLEHHGLRCWLA